MNETAQVSLPEALASEMTAEACFDDICGLLSLLHMPQELQEFGPL